MPDPLQLIIPVDVLLRVSISDSWRVGVRHRQSAARQLIFAGSWIDPKEPKYSLRTKPETTTNTTNSIGNQ